MPEEPEEGFVVRDRRRFISDTPEETPVEKPAASAPVSPPPHLPEETVALSSGELAADEAEQVAEEVMEESLAEGQLPSVFSVLMMTMHELSQLSVLRLGLVPNPGTGEIEQDLVEAKVAIDTVTFLAAQLEPVFPPEERLPLKAMVSDLQLHFVEQAKKSQVQ